MLIDAQSTMRQYYINGGHGAIISGLVWCFAGAVTALSGFQPGIISFFFGGMLIHPMSVYIARRINPSAPAPDKKLTQLSLFTLPILFGGLYLAYTVSIGNHALFYPVMATVIGGRYLVFTPIYGLKAFTALGIILTLTGCAAYFVALPLVAVPLLVGIIELLFGGWLIASFLSARNAAQS